MASVSVASSANQYGVQQLRYQELRRNADKAEQTAQSLKAQADNAQRVVERDKEKARSLSVQSDQAREDSVQARLKLANLNSAKQTISQLTRVVDQVIAREQSSAQKANPSPVVNAQGQVTGTIINATA